MSTRANIILVTPNNLLRQYYHHSDGYFSGVGEELRKYLVFSIGMNTITKTPIYNILRDELNKNREYEDEYKLDLDKPNQLHGDIEFLYIIKDTTLYGCYAWDLYKKVNTNKELLDYVCVDKNKINLAESLKDK
jgi:hypothetical protein